MFFARKKADFLIVGLGNPGEGYAHTRHNIGFMVADCVHVHIKAGRWKKVGQSMVAKTQIAGKTVIIAKPLTYMNLSGEAISSLIRRFMLDSKGLVVIHDDMHIPFGALRIKTAGGDGGHNGIRSAIDHLGGGDFIRLKVGIGHKTNELTTPDFVLSEFTTEERKSLPAIISRADEAVCTIIDQGAQRAMNIFHTLNRETN